MVKDIEALRIQIQTLAKSGRTTKQTMEITKASKTMINKWKGIDNFSDSRRSGRPSKLTPKTKKAILRVMKDKKGAFTRKCVKKLNYGDDFKKRSKTISRRTVERHLKTREWRRNSYKFQVKPMLSQRNINDRLNFVNYLEKNNYLGYDSRSKLLLNHVLFTDESPIELHPKPNRQNTRIRTS